MILKLHSNDESCSLLVDKLKYTVPCCTIMLPVCLIVEGIEAKINMLHAVNQDMTCLYSTQQHARFVIIIKDGAS